MKAAGAVTAYIDVAQIVLYAFWIFFAGLIIYLRREDKREGYPLESERSAHIKVQGFPAIPKPKRFLLAHGGSVEAPRQESDPRPILATAAELFPGAPLLPTGNPMVDAVGPAAYALRANEPDRTLEGEPMIVPMRRAPGFEVASQDPDPRGMAVYGADEEIGGHVKDVWVDRAEPQIRYLELETTGTQRVLLPINFVRFDTRAGCVRVRAILGRQFAQVPTLANPEMVTRREEDRICAYYAGGHLYATAERAEPLL